MTNEEFIKSISLEGEIWKDVVGYEGYYMVSSFGRVVSLSRNIKFFNTIKKKDAKLMSNVSKPDQYNSVVLKVDGKKHCVRVHRLVATAFLCNPNNYRCVDHIDGDKTNNYISNLRWCSDEINQNNPVTREKQRRTLILKKSKFAPKKVVGIKKDGSIVIYNTICESKKDGYIQSMISECCNGKRKHHHGVFWMHYSDYKKSISMSKNSIPNPG